MKSYLIDLSEAHIHVFGQHLSHLSDRNLETFIIQDPSFHLETRVNVDVLLYHLFDDKLDGSLFCQTSFSLFNQLIDKILIALSLLNNYTN